MFFYVYILKSILSSFVSCYCHRGVQIIETCLYLSLFPPPFIRLVFSYFLKGWLGIERSKARTRFSCLLISLSVQLIGLSILLNIDSKSRDLSSYWGSSFLLLAN